MKTLLTVVINANQDSDVVDYVLTEENEVPTLMEAFDEADIAIVEADEDIFEEVLKEIDDLEIASFPEYYDDRMTLILEVF
jgi:hypothetical protein